MTELVSVRQADAPHAQSLLVERRRPGKEGRRLWYINHSLPSAVLWSVRVRGGFQLNCEWSHRLWYSTPVIFSLSVPVFRQQEPLPSSQLASSASQNGRNSALSFNDACPPHEIFVSRSPRIVPHFQTVTLKAFSQSLLLQQPRSDHVPFTSLDRKCDNISFESVYWSQGPR